MGPTCTGEPGHAFLLRSGIDFQQDCDRLHTFSSINGAFAWRDFALYRFFGESVAAGAPAGAAIRLRKQGLHFFNPGVLVDVELFVRHRKHCG